MKVKISALIITKNSQETIEKTINSVKDFDEIVIIDSISTDKTIKIIKKSKIKNQNDKLKLKIYRKDFGYDIGKQRQYGLRYLTGDWVLILDSDEVVSKKLLKEIKSKILSADRQVKNQKFNITAYEIPYQNYFLNRQVNYGGEDYKMVRLFKKDALEIKPSILHNKLLVKYGKLGKMKGKIIHHSYRSLWQVYSKFTDYSFRMAEIKAREGEKSSFKKIFFYPIHMFWARFIKDKGYKDGFFRIPLDVGFAYMEFLTYLILFFKNLRSFFYKQN